MICIKKDWIERNRHELISFNPGKTIVYTIMAIRSPLT